MKDSRAVCKYIELQQVDGSRALSNDASKCVYHLRVQLKSSSDSGRIRSLL